MTRSPLRLRLLALALTASSALGLSACSGSPSEDDIAAAAALVEQGLDQLQSGDAPAAEATFDRALRLDDEQHLAHYNLGVIDQDVDQFGDAREHFEAALEVAPEHGPSLYNLAIITERDDLEAAVELYRRAIEAHPSHAPTYMRLGFALNHLGQVAEAETLLAKALELDPTLTNVEAPRYQE